MASPANEAELWLRFNLVCKNEHERTAKYSLDVFDGLLFFIISACGGMRTDSKLPVLSFESLLSVLQLRASWERVDCSWHHH